MKLKQFFKNNWHFLVVVILALCFFGGTAFYNSEVRSSDFMKWGSPDESANYVFTKRYAQTGELKIFKEYNLYTDDIIRPRSTRSDHGEVKPVSFLGLPFFYGNISKIFGYNAIPYITPFLGALGIIFFYLLVREIFGRRNALISSFLLASFPVYIYYTSRSMFHNVPFMVFLIIGLYFLVRMTSPEKRPGKKFFDLSLGQLKYRYVNWINAALGGGAIGLALAFRTSEALWLLPALFVLWLFNIKKVGFSKLVIAIGFCFLAILPVVCWNQILFGSPTSGCYPEMNQSIHSLSSSGGEFFSSTIRGQLSSAKEIINRIIDTVFYFGYDPDKSWETFQNYFIKMFPALFFSACLGLIIFLQNWHKRRKRFWAFLLAYSLASIFLVLYYGSWVFHDNPDPKSVTIGNSYTRYWLPIYLGAMPLASFFIIRFSRGIFPIFKKEIRLYKKQEPKNIQDYLDLYKKERWFKTRTKLIINGIRVVIVSFFIYLSLIFVLYGSEEGLIYTAQKNEAERTIFNKVLDRTEQNSVIITQYHDKTFYPERMVIYGLFDDRNMIERYSQVAKYLPLYYFNFSLGDPALNYLNSSPLKEFGLEIKEVEKISPDFTLYRLKLR